MMQHEIVRYDIILIVRYRCAPTPTRPPTSMPTSDRPTATPLTPTLIAELDLLELEADAELEDPVLDAVCADDADGVKTPPDGSCERQEDAAADAS